MQGISWQSIAETPWWIYPIWAYCFWLGYLTTRPHRVPVKGLIYLPLLYGVVAFPLFFLQFDFALANILLWVSGFFLGAPLGFLVCEFKKMQLTPEKTHVYIPGSFLSLLFIVGLAGIYFHFHPNFFYLQHLNKNYQVFYFGLFGLSLGFLIRTICLGKISAGSK